MFFPKWFKFQPAVILAWNDPSIGINWPDIVGSYSGSASADGYSIDGVPLNLSEKRSEVGWFQRYFQILI